MTEKGQTAKRQRQLSLADSKTILESKMQTYSGKDEFGVKVANGASEKYTPQTKEIKPAFSFSPKEKVKAEPSAPKEQDLKVARAKAILAGNSKRRYYKKKSYQTSQKRTASYDAPHWSLLDQPAVDNQRGWGNMISGLGRDLTVSQCRDLGAMPNQRRDWSDWRGTAKKAK